MMGSFGEERRAGCLLCGWRCCVRTMRRGVEGGGGDRAVYWIGGGIFDILLLISFPLSFNLSFFFSLCLEGRRKKKKKKKKKGNKSILY